MIKLLSPIRGYFASTVFLIAVFAIAPWRGLKMSLELAPLILGLVYGVGITSVSIRNKLLSPEKMDVILWNRKALKIINLIAIAFVLVSSALTFTEKTASVLLSGIRGYSLDVLLVLSWEEIFRKQKIVWNDL